MVPVQLLVLEKEVGNHGKHYQRYALLDYLQLYQVERTAIVNKSDAVGRYLTAVLKESYRPRKGNH